MSKKIAKRLQLSAETIHTLSSSLLEGVAGGYVPPPTENPSVIDGCQSRRIGCRSFTCPQ